MATCPNKNLQEWKDLVAVHGEDMAYFLWNKTSGNVSMLQLEGSESTQATAPTLEQVKLAAKKMGIRFNSLGEYAQEHPEVDVSGANAVADMLQGVVAVAEGKEDVALTEEVVHIATQIIEQTNPSVITSLISKISKYKIYKDVFNQYKNNKHYQTSDGKPDIRKIKKEALDKLLTEVIVKSDQDVQTFPELQYADTLNWFQRVWEDIKKAIRQLYQRSDVDLFKRVAADIKIGDVGGTVDNLSSEDIFLQTVPINAAVNAFYDKMLEVDKDLILVPEQKDNNGEVIKKRHYTYKGVEIDMSVTEKINQNKDFSGLEDEGWKMIWGTEGHAYLELYFKNLIDENGFKRSIPLKTPISTRLNKNVKASIELFAEDLINSYPEGTRFLAEVKAVNTQAKTTLASTIDFMALIPTKDRNGKEDVKVDILDWKFTSFNANRYQDLSPGKQKAWKMQMGEYVNMMTTSTYKLNKNSLRKTRMIPFIAHYSYNIPLMPESGLYLTKIEVGNVDETKENNLYLLPVPSDQESTGNSKVDQLVNGLEKQRLKMFKKLRSPKERFEKDQEMAAITQAIKKLRVQLDFDPLYNVGRDLNRRVENILEDYKKINFATLTPENVEKVLREVNEYVISLEKFVGLREIYNDYLGKDDDKLTKEETVVKNKINSVSNKAAELTSDLRDLQKAFVVEQAVKTGEASIQNKEDVLKPEIAIDNMSYSFLEGTRLSARIIRVASNMILRAKKLVDIVVRQRIDDFGKLLLDLEEQASSMGVKAFDLIGNVTDTDLQLINKIDREYFKKQKEAIANEDKKFFKDNMDVDSYKKMVDDILKERYAIINDTIYTEDPKENKERRELAKKNLRNKIDIFSPGFASTSDKYFLYIYKQNFKEENHYSNEFQELKKNEAAYKVWEYFMNLNKEARDLGYLSREKQSFFPLIEATSLQKLQQTKDYTGQTVDFFKDVYMSRINESMEYNSIDPETGEVKKSIPKYFTKTDKNVEQLSRDLNLVGALWIRSIEQYKSSKNMENALHTMHMVEQAKGSIVRDGGKTVYDGGQIVVDDKNNPNAKILETIIDDALYNRRESTTSIGNKVINMGVSKFAKDEEDAETKGLNVRKTINSANDLVRLLALGLKVPLGVANWAGTQFQTFIKSGQFYTFKQYEKAHAKVTFSDLGTLSLEEKGMIDLFVPLNDDTALETRRKIAKKQGLKKYLSTWTFSDTLMLTMQFPEKKLQFANAMAFLENTIVIDGKLENARQYVKRKDREGRSNLSYEERKDLRKSYEDRVKEVLDKHSLKNKIKVTDDSITIPGISLDQIAAYRTKIIDYNRTLNGMMDENDKMGFRRDTLFSSFMMFKSWIPKLVYVRAGKLEKNLQTEEWDYGRARAFTKALIYKDVNSQEDLNNEKTKSFVTRWNFNIVNSVRNINDIVKFNDRGIEIMNNILYEKKMRHLRDTGQELEITEEEFQDLMRDAVVAQFKELGVLMAVMGSYFGAVIAEPPEDASALEKNQYKWYFRQVNKIADEITFYYDPTSTEAILQGTFIPAVGLLSKIKRFSSQLVEEAWGTATGNKDMVEDAHPTKYFFNLIPILSQGQKEFLPYIDPELAKEMGIRVTKEARKN